MNLLCRCMLITWWMKVGLTPGVVSHLSKEDVLLLKNEESPKCFTRTQKDLTCFFETSDSNTYDLFYESEGRSKKRCELSVQTTEDGDFLHICNFPKFDIYLFITMYIQVVQRTDNKSLYSRNVCVEDHNLLDAPFNVSLHPNVKAGELRVLWQTKSIPYIDKTYKIRYSSETHRSKTAEVQSSDWMLSLTPGEKAEVQVAVKTSLRGHWSSWSQPARAVVPQKADDIALICSTSDLQYVTCRWDTHRYKNDNTDEEKEYKLFYKMDLREKDEWTECLDDGTTNDMCCFHGNKLRQISVKLICTSASISRTFFTEFQLNKSIKTSPPGQLRRVQRSQSELCLEWETPFPSLSDDLKYEVHFQIKGDKQWKIYTCSETNTCVNVSGGRHFTVKIRAEPTGSNYSGYWSDWSNVLTGYTTPDIGLFPVWSYILIPMFLITIVFIGFFCLCYSRIKEYVWPPVPNLQEVLQGYLTEINKRKWDPPVAGKQCFEEGRPSVVEILSEVENPGLVKPSEESADLLSSNESFSSGEQTDGSPDVFPDYVTLKETVVLCLVGNSYVSELIKDNGGPEVVEEPLQICQYSCNDGSPLLKSCLGKEMVNYSYLPMVEPPDSKKSKSCDKRGLGNIYTNLSNN